MGVTVIEKPKGKGKAETANLPEKLQIAALVDQLGGLKTSLEQLEAEPVFTQARDMATEIGQIEEDIRNRIDGTVAKENKVEIAGSKYVASIGAKGKVRSFKKGAMKAIHKMMGASYFDLVTMRLKDLDDYLNPEQRAKVVNEELTAKRRISVKVK